ncbi:MAG TPA: mechanosensitive ion channel family protein [Dongiaceae bacterium]|nr:mechanosensitive ion channel family protein [Dongiaceae bacterium]
MSTTISSDPFQYIADTYLNWHAILTFVLCIGVSLIIGRILAYFIRKAVNTISATADKSPDLRRVNRLRRVETILVLSIAAIRAGLVLLGIYVWWLLDHPDTQPTALIGASAVVLLILSASLSPMIRDIAAGASMMIEQWYGVGDHIKIEPFADMQGVVERVTLRSTRIRNINGEIIWVNNQNIQGVRLTQKGIRTIALELFVTDLERGRELINEANDRLPIGSLLLVNPLMVREELKVGKNLWHITAIGETAPEREWLIEKAAVDLIKELDETSKNPVISHGPLARHADSDADRRFKRTITNARKNPKPKKRQAVYKTPTQAVKPVQPLAKKAAAKAASSKNTSAKSRTKS